MASAATKATWICAGILASTAVWGVNTQFLLLDPIRYFNDQDWEMETAAAIDAAENLADGTSRSWENPETGQSGSVSPLRTYTNEQQEQCRTLHFTNRKDDLSSAMTIEGCKNAGGDWYISGATPRGTQ